MAGIAIVLDMLKKNPSLGSAQSSGFFSATAATASAAASASASAAPFASRFLFGNFRIPVAYCDAGATLPGDYITDIRSSSQDVFQRDLIKYTPKEYYFHLRPMYSAFEFRALAVTTVRSFLMFYLPLLEPRAKMEEDDDEDFLEDTPEQPVDLVVPFKKSVKQIIRETTVVTTRRVLERMAVHYVSQRMAWKLLKDIPKSAMRKAGRGLPTVVYFFRVGRTTFRAHTLGVAASWLVQVGIEVYRFASRVLHSKEEEDKIDIAGEVKLLGKKISGATVRCGSSLVFASIGAGVGAVLFRPSLGQWIGCAVGDIGGPVIVMYCLEKTQLSF